MSFLVDEDEDKKEEITTQEENKKLRPTREDRIPPNYIEIKLSSLGRLTAPSMVHVRDYNGEEVLQMAMATEDNLVAVLINCIDNMLYESFDASLLHEKELEEILLNLYVNFWGTKITSYPYPYEEEELEEVEDKELKERIVLGEYYPTVDIEIRDLKNILISEDFKEPFEITYKGETYTFRLPRIKDILIASNYIKEKYQRESQLFHEVEEILKFNNKVKERFPDRIKPIENNLIEEYRNFSNKKAIDFFKVRQSQCILAYGKKNLDTLEKQINIYPQISMSFWRKFRDITEKEGLFGVNNEVQIKSPLTGKPVTRRFLFRFMDIIPTDKLQTSDDPTVKFGA